jgi:hypothetical protein
METRAEILAWLRAKIAARQSTTIGRWSNDGGAYHDGFDAALQWVADELDTDEEPPKCS